MENIILEKLKRAFELYNDLIKFLPEEKLAEKLPGLASNQLGQQLWCVIGARNSYLKALKAGAWQGFECPLKWEKTVSKSEVKVCLKETTNQVLTFLNSGSDYSKSIALDLLEHEVQHHGQVIRYMYGFKLGAPETWRKRYNLG